MVKRVILGLALLVATPRAVRADEDPLLLKLEQDGRNLRLQGIVTTTAGFGMLAITTILWLRGDECVGPPVSSCSGFKWLTLSLGLPTTGFGVTMWWLGQHDLNQAAKLRSRTLIAPYVARTHDGMTAGVDLTF
jgi:hypothetical protein